MTEVHINAKGPTGRGTKITQADGTEIKGVRHAVIDIPASGPITAAVKLLTVTAEVRGQLQLQIADPATGEMKLVTSIAFADGTEYKA